MSCRRPHCRARRALLPLPLFALVPLIAGCGGDSEGAAPAESNEDAAAANPLSPGSAADDTAANPLAPKPGTPASNPLAGGGGANATNPLAGGGSGANAPNPLAPSGDSGATPDDAPAVQDVPLPEATDAGRVAVSGQLYEHPLGYRFRYPQGWKLQQVSDDVLSLVPDDVRTNAQGATEVFLALGGPAEGTTDPGHPEIVRFVDMLVRSTFPFLKRSGDVAGGRHGGRPSAAVTWKGKGPDGVDYTATMWITILKDAALGMTAICPDATFEARRPMAEAIFSSFEWEPPPVDRAVVGVWRNQSTYISGEFSAVTVRKMGFQADGTAFWGSGGSSFGMSHTDSAGNFTGSTTGSAQSGDVLEGRWNTANKTLYIVWESGEEEEFTYYIEGTTMMLTPAGGGKNKLWERIQ